MVVRTKLPGRDVLDAATMLPLAVPGIVLAFGLVAELILCAAHNALTGLPASPSCRITALMRRDGFEVNGKRVGRIRREEGIKVSKKQRRMKRLGISTAQRQ